MAQTLQISSKDLMCIPTYVGYLAIRERLGKHGDSLILVDRHFCNDGKSFIEAKTQNKPRDKEACRS